ncbi:2OG-Fe(II) oxygenase [Oleiphilus sp. HI0081]|nr:MULTISPECIES: 2OG-Fe(II) oxygenase [unclassified Oleiphilus]KZY43994.1 2OG-Fe(II) oxygenase [Oleiphilus sp. HI0050]KZY83797.1 2OG-Fe(II) oxygenase [Oleiphilus sp. HI0068]KZY85903.1 2OG-Fe(II) oxygenase [Oleiphilus sp. HI0072]KZY86564.1 2OG-Fe(II) oxygenase [Oleiphilus sp. HI0069]KZZ09490.1 2OG-Fe(II) oxygenase [Oleiphilus sp. HI0078]KZZ19824.1 2OG-Fe(II) oxygenase [Oleiphilus sp. HI0081]
MYLSSPEDNEVLFESIAQDLIQTGCSINEGAIPQALADALAQEVKGLASEKFKKAGIGREQDFVRNETVRSDEIAWISEETEAGKAWLEWASQLQSYMNRRLYLGLFSFESHFAHYSAGDFYQRHLDAFKGQSNRTLTLVAYFNKDWTQEDGGELVVYKDQDDQEGQKVLPSFATLVVFLSEEFPHEVLPAKKDRYSIAGWFRVNTSSADRVDPPE